MRRATLLHLRIPFSFFLLPVFLFALADGPFPLEAWRVGLCFACLHLFLYPASNGFNSYYDKDEESIGGLASPPPVSRELLYASLGMDAVALALGAPFGWGFVGMLLGYGIVSKAYSHDKVRLKKRPWASWLAASLFQGGFTYLMCQMSLRGASWAELTDVRHLLPALLTSLMIGGFYPLTQVYQHGEDARRGDLTLSRLLGIRGTFHFCFVMFALAGTGFLFFFWKFYAPIWFAVFLGSLAPALVFLVNWYLKVRKDEAAAAWRPAMRMNLWASGGLVVFYGAMAVMGLIKN